jgi:tRNA 2-thiouridine synthesizing protein E
MPTLQFSGKSYQVDANGFLLDHQQWDRNFAQGLAPEAKIPAGLTEEHWKVIQFIREAFAKTGECPVVYQTCKANGLLIKDLKRLFPAGYLRGACKLAGITYADRQVNFFGEGGLGPGVKADLKQVAAEAQQKVYRVDVYGFLVDWQEWDEYFALRRAHDLKIPGGLSEGHWKIIRFLRERFEQTGTVPTLYETCEANHLELQELERLFPDGYHRGAVRIAGLRAR